MPRRRNNANDDTIYILENWTEAQKRTERLAAAILHLQNYTDIDPSHPTGGRDTGKDIICKKDGDVYIAAVTFNSGRQLFSKTKTKYLSDLKSALNHKPDGFIFFTNQKLSVGERKELSNLAPKELKTKIYALENIAATLSAPIGYGVRLEYLNIEMSKDEQISYFSTKDAEINKLHGTLKELLDILGKSTGIPDISPERLNEFKNTLELIVNDRSNLYGYGGAMIDRLKVPLSELQQFGQELQKLFYGFGFMPDGRHPIEKFNIPLDDLKEFRVILNELLQQVNSYYGAPSAIDKLSVPLNAIKEYHEKLISIMEIRKPVTFGYPDPLKIPVDSIENYNSQLDQAIIKLKEIQHLKSITGQ